MRDTEVYVIKPATDSEEVKKGEGIPASTISRCLRAPITGSFSPPICIGADLLTEALTRVAFYCTGKQKH